MRTYLQDLQSPDSLECAGCSTGTLKVDSVAKQDSHWTKSRTMAVKLRFQLVLNFSLFRLLSAWYLDWTIGHSPLQFRTLSIRVRRQKCLVRVNTGTYNLLEAKTKCSGFDTSQVKHFRIHGLNYFADIVERIVLTTSCEVFLPGAS